MEFILKLLPWFVVLCILGLVPYVIKALQKKKEPAAASHRYEKQDALMSPGELEFFRALEAAVGDTFRVFSKVRLADIVKPVRSPDKRAWYSAFGVIKSKHVDFVVCDPATMDFRLVLELDDKSHKQKSRSDRDEKVDAILEQAGVPILHVPQKASYSVEDLQRQIFGEPATTT